MTDLTEEMREAAVDLVAHMPGVGSVHSEDVDLVAFGMAHAAELIRADVAALSDVPEVPANAAVNTFQNAVHGAKQSVRVILESGRVGQCFGEPSGRTGRIVATDRALIQERIANGEWLK